MDSPWIGWFFEKFHLVLSYNVFKLQFKLILSRIYTKRKFSIFRSTILWVSLRDFITAAQENGLYHFLQILGKWFCRQSLHFPKIKFRPEKMVFRNLDLSVFFVSRLTLRAWKIHSTAKFKGGGIVQIFSIIFVVQTWTNQGKILEL
jgi:hypothetical protein